MSAGPNCPNWVLPVSKSGFRLQKCGSQLRVSYEGDCIDCTVDRKLTWPETLVKILTFFLFVYFTDTRLIGFSEKGV